MLVGLALLAAPAANADIVTVALDQADQTVVLSTSGPITLDFTGTVSIAAGYSWDGAELDFLFTSDSSHKLITTFGIDTHPAENGGSVSGILFTVQVNPTDLPDLYAYHGFSTDLARFSVSAKNSLGEVQTGSANFSVLVTAVPEPSSLALAGTGLVALVGVVRRRRQIRAE